MNQKMIAIGFVVAVVIALGIAWLAGGFGKSPVAGQSTMPVDRNKLAEDVNKLMTDWGNSCPLEQESYSGPGSVYFEYPRCGASSNFNLNNYEKTTVVAFLMAFNIVKDGFINSPRAPPSSMNWTYVKEIITRTVYDSLK